MGIVFGIGPVAEAYKMKKPLYSSPLMMRIRLTKVENIKQKRINIISNNYIEIVSF